MGRRIAFMVGAGLGCLVGLSGPAGGAPAQRCVSTAATVGRLERKIRLVQQECRLRSRAEALVSERALFDEDAFQGRSLSPRAPDPTVADPSGPMGRPVDVRPEVSDREIRRAESLFPTVAEALKAEIRALRKQLLEARGKKPQG